MRVAPAPCGSLRRLSFSALTLLGVFFLYLPVLEGGVYLLLAGVPSLGGLLDPSATGSIGAGTLWKLFTDALLVSLVLLFGATLVGLLVVVSVPRVLNLFITARQGLSALWFS